jgi:hypothetical protein
MKYEAFVDKLWRHWVTLVSRRWPAVSLRWRNRSLFDSVNARVWRAILVGCFGMVLVAMLWHLFTATGWFNSQQFELKQLQIEHATLRQKASLQQIKTDALAAANEQRKASRLEYQLELDDLILAWPNSAFRNHLMHHLQHIALAKNLRIDQMKLMPLPNEHGFEVATLVFGLKGSKVSTYSFWQSLNQLFQNGIWTALTWRLMPEGHYSLEGQLHLLWDAEDAFTDTGVEMQAASLKVADTKALVHDTHVWPDQALSQIRLVGAAQSFETANKELVWTLLQSGRQIQAVRAGQYLGMEKRRVMSVDAKGLWLEGGPETATGMPSTLLAWEKVLP